MKDFWRDIIDNDTLIILALAIYGGILLYQRQYGAVTGTIIGTFAGYIRGKNASK